MAGALKFVEQFAGRSIHSSPKVIFPRLHLFILSSLFCHVIDFWHTHSHIALMADILTWIGAFWKTVETLIVGWDLGAT
jgi:hypothetical protein